MTLYAITTYFNPSAYKTRRQNYERFCDGLDEVGVPLLTVELAFGDADFELSPSPWVVQIRSASMLWQKERLLNLAASWLPAHVDKVAWLDADILFRNSKWAVDLENILEIYPIAQVWQQSDRLDSDGKSVGDIVTSFAERMMQEPELLSVGRYDAHGHTGYGWAMRREIFQRAGLYESAVSGSSDHLMAHAIFGQYGFCVENALKHDHRQVSHVKAWGRRFYSQVQGQLAVVPGDIQHLWHGSLVDRQYFSRMHTITDMGFDPWTDLVAQPGRPLEWSKKGAEKSDLLEFFPRYFESRKEDGHHV